LRSSPRKRGPRLFSSPWPDLQAGKMVRLRNTRHLGQVPILASGVPVTLRASRPEFWCEQQDPLSAQLRARRRKLGLTVGEAAKLVGVGRWTFGLWENGRRRPSAHVRPAIARFLGHET